jgi:hypothetical protein
MKRQDSGENCMRGLYNFTVHQILLGERDGRAMQHKKLHSVNVNRRNSLGNLGTNGRIILK